MSVHEVTYYQAKCDACGTICDDYGNFSAWVDSAAAIDMAGDWFSMDAPGVVRDLCPDCQVCEVCKAERAYEADGHLVCDKHEDHVFGPVES